MCYSQTIWVLSGISKSQEKAEGICLCLFAQNPHVSNVPAAPSSGGIMNIVVKIKGHLCSTIDHH